MGENNATSLDNRGKTKAEKFPNFHIISQFGKEYETCPLNGSLLKISHCNVINILPHPPDSARSIRNTALRSPALIPGTDTWPPHAPAYAVVLIPVAGRPMSPWQGSEIPHPHTSPAGRTGRGFDPLRLAPLPF
jgi:hypothetical protein